MVVLPFAVALRYYNYCTDGSTSPENYGYHLICYKVELNSDGIHIFTNKDGFIPVICEIARVVCDVPFVLMGAGVKFLNF
jgi:hypothetical protein